ncbi:MAG: hypothetical protein IJI41_08275 [Anaerolineaceae bacterium]|nr:hypothetical protein [Anaerolineaceae bacterium]
MNKQKQLILSLVTILLLTALFLLFSDTTSPLYPNNYGVDSAFNRFMGLMVRRGKVLYSEIWDNKGPVLFFLQAIGTLKGTHNADITLTFLMQILSMFLTIFFLYRADFNLHRRKVHILRVILLFLCSMSVFCILMEGGNLSEEWSLPMIGCSLYLLTKYAVNVKDAPDHPCRNAFIHGICVGLLAFIRINNAVSIFAGVLIVGMYLIIQRKWKNILANILSGVMGLAVVAVPICLYFWRHNALGDMLYGVFSYNLKYAAQRTHKDFSGAELVIRILPMAVSLLILLLHLVRERHATLLDVMMLMIVTANAVMLWSSNIFRHYYVIYVPVFLLVLLLYVDFRKLPELAIVLGCFIFFVIQDIPLLSGLPAAKDEPDRFAFAASIPEEEKNSAMALYVSPAVYLNSGLIPCSRYAAYHFAHFPVDPAMKEEFLHDMYSEPPNWIIYLSGYEGIITEIYDLLEDKYEWVVDEYGVSYYRRVNSGEVRK